MTDPIVDATSAPHAPETDIAEKFAQMQAQIDQLTAEKNAAIVAFPPQAPTPPAALVAVAVADQGEPPTAEELYAHKLAQLRAVPSQTLLNAGLRNGMSDASIIERLESIGHEFSAWVRKL